MMTTIARIGLTTGILLLLGATGAHAVDKCRVSVDKRTGVLSVSATGVSGTLLWGATMGAEAKVFFNATTCSVGGNARRCQIADPMTLDAKTPPAGCTIYLDDAGAPCSAWIRGCTPGPREGTSTTGAGTLVLVDVNDAIVGNVIPEYVRAAYRDFWGTVVEIPVMEDGSDFEWWGSLFYINTDCSGQPLVFGAYGLIRRSWVLDGVLYYAQDAGTSTAWGSQLYSSPEIQSLADCDAYCGGPGVCTFKAEAPAGCCNGNLYAQDYNLAVPVTVNLSTIGVPPFRVAVR